MGFEDGKQKLSPEKREETRKILEKIAEVDERIELLKTQVEYRTLKGRNAEAAVAGKQLEEARAEKERLDEELMRS